VRLHILSYKHWRSSPAAFGIRNVRQYRLPITPTSTSNPSTVGIREEKHIQPKKKQGNDENRSGNNWSEF
jgi:hypothetical protein